MKGAPPPATGALRLGIDVGGTFTDIVVSWAGGAVHTKVSSTPDAPAQAVMSACEEVARLLDLPLAGLLGRLDRFGLGTTVVTNILATGAGRTLGLITTAGFEDLIPLARGYRLPDAGWLVTPEPLVPRDRIIGVSERAVRSGQIVRPVAVEEVQEAARQLVDRGASSLVVSFLWAFRNPANETAAVDAVRQVADGVPVLSAAAFAPVFREYERTQLALLNAYVGGALDWLDAIGHRLRQEGLATEMLLMHSNGGAVPLAVAVQRPIGLAQSGPAAGASAVTRLVDELGEKTVVACDMGGTSLDVSLIVDGEALRRSRGRLMDQWTALSMVDVDSVGSGGGSIAWTDALGGLRVGPASAGSHPGPACYRRGGTEATVTDALVVLGYIDPARFLGGRMALGDDLARQACGRLGAALGLDGTDTAWGIREVALARMTKAVRNRLATRGLAAADLGLVAFGGCGPLFGADIGRLIGARHCLVPRLASVFSAYGAAVCSITRERVASVVRVLPVPDDELAGAYAGLVAQVSEDLASDGCPPTDCDVRLEADLRFERQGATVTVRLGRMDPAEVRSGDLMTMFVDEYRRRFGEGAVSAGVKIELVNVRATGTGPAVASASVTAATAAAGVDGTGGATAGGTTDDGTGGPPVARTRPVHLQRGQPPSDVAVIDWDAVGGAWSFDGPVLVDTDDTTVWVPPGCTVATRGDTLMIERRGS